VKQKPQSSRAVAAARFQKRVRLGRHRAGDP
jgi:hypothetical protein